MFDRCRSWRRMLSQRADGALPVEQWGALDDHLARCSRCRSAERADSALHAVMGIHNGLPDPEEARAFDNRVMAALRAARSPMRLTDMGLRWMQARWNALPLTFLYQVAGGALVAASLTALCLQSAAHSTAPAMDTQATAVRSLLGNGPSQAPVPLEALLQSRTLRAAELWTTPSASAPRPSASPSPARNVAPHNRNHGVPSSSPSIAPDGPRQHGGLDPSVLPG